MQVDMHYYGTYCLARAAGISAENCHIIARSAEFVDDNASKDSIIFADGARLDITATAHHTTDIQNLNQADQRQIWVPFHFLPGNKGDAYGERLICQMDSEVAQQMVKHHLSQAQRGHSLELMGITAHVYADTFSHYGFSGISSNWNRIEDKTLKTLNLNDKEVGKHKNLMNRFFKNYQTEVTNFFANAASAAAEGATGALGHGGALTFPDRPYLKWSYIHDHTNLEVVRDNPATFLLGCEKLHQMFCNYAKERPDHCSDAGKTWDQIKDEVKAILATVGEADERTAAWKDGAKNGPLFVSGEDIKDYSAAEMIKKRNDLKLWTDSSVVTQKSIFRFYQAASFHRNYVLRELLPSYQLLVA